MKTLGLNISIEKDFTQEQIEGWIADGVLPIFINRQISQYPGIAKWHGTIYHRRNIGPSIGLSRKFCTRSIGRDVFEAEYLKELLTGSNLEDFVRDLGLLQEHLGTTRIVFIEGGNWGYSSILAEAIERCGFLGDKRIKRGS